MIIDKRKIIFIHIPKNAGTSVKNLFSKKLERPFQNKTINEIKKENPKAYDLYRKFAVVRNPYDRVISWYAYQKRYRSDKNLVGYNDLINTYQYINGEYVVVDTVKAPIDAFKNWLKEQNTDPQQDLQLFKPQCAWVDETVTILKYENLNEGLSDFLKKEINLPITNETSRYDTLAYYDQESLDIIYNRCKEDFEKFNYKKL